jgi:hypothetical protein
MDVEPVMIANNLYSWNLAMLATLKAKRRRGSTI